MAVIIYNIHWNSRDGVYHVDREGHGFLNALPSLPAAITWILEGYGWKGDDEQFTINYKGDLFS